MASSVDIQRHPSKDKQTRSCSPSKASPDNPNARRRSRSPSRRQHYHRHDSPRVKRKRSLSSMVAPLPFNARALSKRDLSEYKPMFALYLDIQKHLVLDDISAAEIKGRWKSFTSKWNRGELAEGWYDPATKQKAQASVSSVEPQSPTKGRRCPSHDGVSLKEETRDEYSDDDGFGPALPANARSSTKVGPASLQDIELRNEQAAEDDIARREDLRDRRRQDRKLQKEHLEELIPRAEPGTRERQLEKKREKADQMRSFRDNKSPGAEDVRDADILGDNGVEGFKARKKELERKKNEREIRKEELMRARAAEREERLAEHRAKEQKTMEMLQALAKERFG